jgi:hypothetical protein
MQTLWIERLPSHSRQQGKGQVSNNCQMDSEASIQTQLCTKNHSRQICAQLWANSQCVPVKEKVKRETHVSHLLQQKVWTHVAVKRSKWMRCKKGPNNWITKVHFVSRSPQLKTLPYCPIQDHHEAEGKCVQERHQRQTSKPKVKRLTDPNGWMPNKPLKCWKQ